MFSKVVLQMSFTLINIISGVHKSSLNILHITCKDISVVVSRDAESAVDFAVHIVNNMTDILEDHVVKIHWRIAKQVDFSLLQDM